MSDPLLQQAWALAEVFAAMALGAFVGLDREISDKPAGIRTHALVAGTAALFVNLANDVTRELAETVGAQLVEADPVRVMVAIVTGISFLGAGTIIRRGSTAVEGLTTSASLLIASGIGVCAALGEWLLGIGTALLTTGVLTGLGRLTIRTHSREQRKDE